MIYNKNIQNTKIPTHTHVSISCVKNKDDRKFMAWVLAAVASLPSYWYIFFIINLSKIDADVVCGNFTFYRIGKLLHVKVVQCTY